MQKQTAVKSSKSTAPTIASIKAGDFKINGRNVEVSGGTAEFVKHYAKATGKTIQQFCNDALRFGLNDGAGKTWEDETRAMMTTFNELENRGEWVRFLNIHNRGFGVGYVKGKLCKVLIAAPRVGEPRFEADEITLAESVGIMREIVAIEVHMESGSSTDDTAHARWLTELQTALAAN